MTEPTIAECEEYWDLVTENFTWNDKSITLPANWGKMRAQLRFLLGYKVNRKTPILEIGPGAGFVPMALKVVSGGLNYTGLDLSGKFAEIPRRIWKLNVKQGDAAEMPFEDEMFEWVLAFDSLEHIRPSDRQKVYAEIKRVTTPMGMIFINNPVTKGFHDPRFDFYLNDKDIGEIAIAVGARIVQMDLYEVKGFHYQFIVLQKEGAECQN